MNLFERIGVDVGRKLPLEEAVSWAAAHRVRFIDVQEGLYFWITLANRLQEAAGQTFRADGASLQER